MTSWSYGFVGFAFLAVAAPWSQAVEPNDSIETATASGLVGIGSTLINLVAVGDGDWPDRDVDIYSFEIDKLTTLPVLVTIDLASSATQFDGFLRLFDAAGVELANDDDRAFSDTTPLLRTVLLASGTYYVGVSSAENPHYKSTIDGSGRSGTGGAYALAISTEAAEMPESAFEPNDSVGSASSMGTDSFAVFGEFIGDGEHGLFDVDVYMLHLTRAARIDVEVRAESIDSTLDPVVRIRNCTSAVAARAQAGECQIGASDDTLGGSVDAIASAGVLIAQDIYIFVSGAGNRRFDPVTAGSGEIGSVGSYELDVSVTYFDIAAPDEPNDSIQMATRLVPFAPGRPDIIEIEGFLGDGRFAPFQGDRDFYEITLLEDSELLTIDVVPLEGSTFDPVVVVYDMNGNPLANNDNTGDSLSASVVLPVGCVPVEEDAKSAFVAVFGTGQRPPIDPFLPFPGATAIEPESIGDGPGSTGAYRLTVAVSPLTVGCVNEPDDVFEDATDTGLVDVGTFVCTNGEIGDGPCPDPCSEVDIWSFQVTQSPIVVEASLAVCRPDALGIFSMGLFDEAGKELSVVDQFLFQQSTDVLSGYLDKPGRYYVVVAGASLIQFDPTVACGSASGNVGTYDLIIRLERGPDGPGLGLRLTENQPVTKVSTIFATQLNRESNRIDAVDADTGALLRSIPAPEPLSGGAEGLAFDGTNLFYLGVGLYPRLYQLDAMTGTVLDELILWIGSGFYSDAVMLGGELFLLDYRNRSVHVVDPFGRRFLRTLDVGPINDITISGGLAALASPKRLYVTDAFNTRAVYEIDPVSGVLVQTLEPPPSVSRPTALASSGSSTLLVGDWQSNVLAGMDPNGIDLGDVSLDTAVGALAGQATGPFADFDLDGKIDLRDFALYQICIAESGKELINECLPGDRNGDEQADLADYAEFPTVMTGP